MKRADPDVDDEDGEAPSSPPNSPTSPQSKMSVFHLKRTVVDMCSRIFRVLGPGFRETVYEKALVVELNEAGLAFVSQAPVPIYYKQSSVGVGYADIVVDNQLVLELKAAKTPISPGNKSQCRGYMRSLHLDHGLVINFCQFRAREEDIEVFDCYLSASFPARGPPQDKASEIAAGPGLCVAPRDVVPYEASQMVNEELDGGVTPVNRAVAQATVVPASRPPSPKRVKAAPADDADAWFAFSYANHGGSSTSVMVKKQ